MPLRSPHVQAEGVASWAAQNGATSRRRGHIDAGPGALWPEEKMRFRLAKYRESLPYGETAYGCELYMRVEKVVHVHLRDRRGTEEGHLRD